MASSPPWSEALVEQLCAVLASTDWPGLTGSEIGRLLQVLRMDDPNQDLTKRHRLFNAMAARQNHDQSSVRLRTFVVRALDPTRYTAEPDRFDALQGSVNEVLSLVGLRIDDAGQLRTTPQARTLDEVALLAGRLQTAMRRRGVHNQVPGFCETELLRRSIFHAVFEATKGLASRLRDMTGSTLDGSELVDACFGGQNPAVRVNPRTSKSELSEHSGFANLLRGVFGTFRNPVAHAPRTEWSLSEEDALDLFSMLSYAHRRLDRATVSMRLDP